MPMPTAALSLLLGTAMTTTHAAALLQSRPPPLRGSDGGFTLDSVQRRLPLIARAVIENNPNYSPELKAALEALADEIARDAPLRALTAEPSAAWEAEMTPLLEAKQTWLSAPWFTVENYFYKRILELTDGETAMADPFAQQKRDSLDGAADAFAAMRAIELDACTQLAPLVSTSLWGNVADLSISAGARLVTPADASAGSVQDTMMLADDTAELCDALTDAKQIVIALDNCGLELLSDLLLVDGLMRITQPDCITLHVKDRPVFVSDVVREDIESTLDWLDENDGGALALRLRTALSDGRLRVSAPSFYTTALPFWEMPSPLRDELGAAAVVVCKGDANYRRLLGDLHWPHDLSFQALMQEYWPTSVAALRTCKSGVLVGVDPEVEAAATAKLPDSWLTGGKFGMVSFAPRKAF